MQNKMWLGSHVGMAAPDYYLGTVKEAISYGSTTFMFYTGAPQNSARTPISSLKIKEGRELLKNLGFDEAKLVVHAPYIINLANTIKPESFEFSTQFLVKELFRTASFGIRLLVLHPGSAVGGDEKEGLNQVVKGLDLALEEDKSDVIVCLETMAGKGKEVGKTFEEIAYIINNCKYKNRLGVCLDTCHINDAGYEVGDVDGILDEFDKTIGLDRLKVIHLNDSKNEKGSHKDRHENIGYGTIGFDVLLKWVHSERIKDVPKILETPWPSKDKAPYKEEISMLIEGSYIENWRDSL